MSFQSLSHMLRDFTEARRVSAAIILKAICALCATIRYP